MCNMAEFIWKHREGNTDHQYKENCEGGEGQSFTV